MFIFLTFQVCDEPHPLLLKDMLNHCMKADIVQAYPIVQHLWRLGYSPEDIISSIMRVTKTHILPEYLKMEFIKVRFLSFKGVLGGVPILWRAMFCP